MSVQTKAVSTLHVTRLQGAESRDSGAAGCTCASTNVKACKSAARGPARAASGQRASARRAPTAPGPASASRSLSQLHRPPWRFPVKAAFYSPIASSFYSPIAS
eukprot:2682956-Rhodomonas_salina.1